MSRQGCKQIMKVFGLDWKKSVQCLDLDFEVHDECLGAKGVEEVGKKLSSAFLPLLLAVKCLVYYQPPQGGRLYQEAMRFCRAILCHLIKRNNNAYRKPFFNMLFQKSCI